MKFKMSEGLGVSTKNAYTNINFNNSTMSSIFSLAENKNRIVTINTGSIEKAGKKIYISNS